MVEFAGWQMPIRYGSIIEEHHQVRKHGGMFDVSHMGRLRFKGKDACAFLDRICSRQIWGTRPGQARYSIVCNENGGCRDDVIVYCINENEYVMVCNAANREKLLGHFEDHRADFTFKLNDETFQTAMVAVQGPDVIDLIARFSKEVPQLKRFRFTIKNLILAKVMIARTGYTGEDGVEIILPAKFALKAIDLLKREIGVDSDVLQPIGLGARDTLRLEAAMPLYGHEITEELDPISAGLNFAVKLDKSEDPEKSPKEVGRFIGQDALQSIAQDSPKRKLVGLILEGKRAARQDMKVLSNADEIGFVTSGCFSPTLEKSIAMAYVPRAVAEEKGAVQVNLGRAEAPAEIVDLPFYKR